MEKLSNQFWLEPKKLLLLITLNMFQFIKIQIQKRKMLLNHKLMEKWIPLKLVINITFQLVWFQKLTKMSSNIKFNLINHKQKLQKSFKLMKIIISQLKNINQLELKEHVMSQWLSLHKKLTFQIRFFQLKKDISKSLLLEMWLMYHINLFQKLIAQLSNEL